MQRYFSTQKIDNNFILNKDDIHHIKTVMRMKDNDKITVVYQNVPYLCHISKGENDINIIIDEVLKKEEDKMLKINLIVPVLKEQKMDYIIQKATELGVLTITPFISERGIVKINNDNGTKKVSRWQKIAKEASEQSKRNDIPKISRIITFRELEEISGIKIVCSTKEKVKNIKNVLKTYKDCDTMSIVVGPEGGLSNREEEKLISSGYIPVSLGERIMRVETVPLYIMSVVNYEFME